jgi:hypothetical protein
LIEGASGGCATSRAVPVILEAPVQIVSEPDVVLHRSAKRAIEVEQIDSSDNHGLSPKLT